MQSGVKVWVAIPMMDEILWVNDWLHSMKAQTYQDFHVVACVNHWESWRSDPDRQAIIRSNEETLTLLNKAYPFPVTVLDHASPGKGWPPKKGGVGWARKKALDTASRMAGMHDILLCMDADTHYPADYIQQVVHSMTTAGDLAGLTVPYYHPLAGDHSDRLILRYEIYMRHYAIQLMQIDNPYGWTAIGSAMAFPVWAYHKVGGMTPVLSGEDFYFMQKLSKTGRLGIWSEALAFPAPRLSDRVIFGTGPALIKGQQGIWSSYPIYDIRSFLKVRMTFDAFPVLFTTSVPTPMDAFLIRQFRTEDLWGPLRRNFKTQKQFVRACMQKVDGLRILQFLRECQAEIPLTDAAILASTYPDELRQIDDDLARRLAAEGLETLPVDLLSAIREMLFRKETGLRRSRLTNTL